jgi:hypothetical protein
MPGFPFELGGRRFESVRAHLKINELQNACLQILIRMSTVWAPYEQNFVIAGLLVPRQIGRGPEPHPVGVKRHRFAKDTFRTN